jgi:hypothetical protein
MDPVLSGAIKALSLLKGYYDAQRLREQLQTIESTLDALGVRIEEVLAVDVRAAYRHLEDATKVDADEARRNELLLACASFVRMTEHPLQSWAPSLQTAISRPMQKEMSGQWVAALGHAGNYGYFLLNDEPRLALQEAYRCGVRLPVLAVQLFPVEIFTQDYRPAARAMLERSENRDRRREVHRAALSSAKESRAEYYREMAWKVPLAGVVFLGHLAACVVSPPLAGQAPMRAVGILQGTGRRSPADIPGALPRLDLGVDGTDPREEAHIMRQASEESARRLRQLEASMQAGVPMD